MKKHLWFSILLLFLLQFSVFSQEKKDTVTSLVIQKQDIPPKVIKATREFRERILADPYRPAFHFCVPEDIGFPGDPNGAFYYKGKYHLMYLYEKTGSGFSWGHVSSKDLLHWRNHPDAIVPGDGDEGCFSGGAFIDDDGTAFLSYWMLWGAKGIGLAKSADGNFDNWEKLEENPVVKSDEWGITEMTDDSNKKFYVGSADPSNIWEKDGRYYMLTGNLLVLQKYGPLMKKSAEVPLPDDSLNYQGDKLYLFSSDNLTDWNYLHEFYQSKRSWTDKTEDNMCPSFLPLPNSPDGGKYSGKHLLLFISHIRGCQYYVGDYKDERFFPEQHGRMSWNDNAFFAPEALVDDKGRQIMWSWLYDMRPDSIKSYYGWAGVYGLPRSLWLGKDGKLRISPVKELEQLRLYEKNIPNVEIKPGHDVKLNNIGTSLMELEVTFEPGVTGEVGVKVCVSEDNLEETVISYNSAENKLSMDTRKSGISYGHSIIEEAPLELKKKEPLILKIFVDKSIVEVFANDKQAITRRIYPTKNGTGVSLFAKGSNITTSSIKAWEIMPSNPY